MEIIISKKDKALVTDALIESVKTYAERRGWKTKVNIKLDCKVGKYLSWTVHCSESYGYPNRYTLGNLVFDHNILGLWPGSHETTQTILKVLRSKRRWLAPQLSGRVERTDNMSGYSSRLKRYDALYKEVDDWVRELEGQVNGN